MSVSGETLQVTIVVSSSDAHVVGVVSFCKGSGADSPDVSVGERDDTMGCAASEVGRGAFMVAMEGRPAVATASSVRAVTGLVSWVLAVTSEAIDVGWEWPLSFAKSCTRWGSWIGNPSSLKTVFSFTVFWLAVRGSLSHEDSWNDTAGGRPRPCAYKMGD